jgi:hypothetical protein
MLDVNQSQSINLFNHSSDSVVRSQCKLLGVKKRSMFRTLDRCVNSLTQYQIIAMDDGFFA